MFSWLSMFSNTVTKEEIKGNCFQLSQHMRKKNYMRTFFFTSDCKKVRKKCVFFIMSQLQSMQFFFLWLFQCRFYTVTTKRLLKQWSIWNTSWILLLVFLWVFFLFLSAMDPSENLVSILLTWPWINVYQHIWNLNLQWLLNFLFGSAENKLLRYSWSGVSAGQPIIRFCGAWRAVDLSSQVENRVVVNAKP